MDKCHRFTIIQGIHGSSWFRIFFTSWFLLHFLFQLPWGGQANHRLHPGLRLAALGCAWLRLAALGCAWLRLALSLWRTKVHAARMRPRGHSGATKGQTIHRNKKHTPGLNISQLLKLQKIQKIQLLGNHNGWQSANVSRLTRNNLLLVAEAPKMVSSQVVTVEKSYVISTSVAVTLKLGKYKVLSKLE